MRRHCIIVLLIISLGVIPSNAWSHYISEYRLKAALVYKFLQYTQIARPAERYRICVSGSKEVFHSFLSIDGKVIANKAVEVVHQLVPEQVYECHAFFLQKGVDIAPPYLVDLGVDHEVLTVGESDDFLKQGGMIRFYEKEGGVHFEVNLRMLTRSNIELSSKVLRLAKIWRER